jgi:tetrahydromethanopterin S-methyltransferase subunit F
MAIGTWFLNGTLKVYAQFFVRGYGLSHYFINEGKDGFACGLAFGHVIQYALRDD